MNNPVAIMNPDRRTVSVIIPTLGRETIRYCLDALERQFRPPFESVGDFLIFWLGEKIQGFGFFYGLRFLRL